MKAIIDLKTGKAQPWTALQTAAYTLLDSSNVILSDEDHIYESFSGGLYYGSVTQILKAEGFIDTTYYTEYGRERGSFVHLACHYDDIGDLDEYTLDPEIKPYLDAYRRFKAESGFIVERSESPMMSTKYLYAGTPDKVGAFPSGNIKRAAVELHNDGSYRLIPYTDRNDVNIWLAVLAVFNWKQNNLKKG
jgi:hypothetical protein